MTDWNPTLCVRPERHGETAGWLAKLAAARPPGNGLAAAAEIPAGRGDWPGVFGDRANLDEIDGLAEALGERGFKPGALLLPYFHTETPEETGAEISLLDGWIDLAVYLNIGRAGLIPANAAAERRETLERLAPAVEYALEMDIEVTVIPGGMQTGPAEDAAIYVPDGAGLQWPLPMTGGAALPAGDLDRVAALRIETAPGSSGEEWKAFAGPFLERLGRPVPVYAALP